MSFKLHYVIFRYGAHFHTILILRYTHGLTICMYELHNLRGNIAARRVKATQGNVVFFDDHAIQKIIDALPPWIWEQCDLRRLAQTRR